MDRLILSTASLILMGGMMSVVWGCAPAARSATIAVSPARREALRTRALEEFDQAVFYKPHPDPASGAASELVPLIVQQVWEDDERSMKRDRIGAPTSIEESSPNGSFGEPGVEGPPVFTGEASIQLGGKRYEQVVYLWGYAGTTAHRGVRWQGIRITVGADGFGLAWEVLGSHDSIMRLFVSSTLERAAEEQFGGPPPGRRFAVERAVEDAPDAVVVRIIEDGPIPMGPYVYLEADTREVTTLLCRCSPSQVRRLVDTVYYRVEPLESLEARGFDVPPMPDNLGRCLRWPFGS